jgi:ribosomal-protein-alanine acetyltransferase
MPTKSIRRANIKDIEQVGKLEKEAFAEDAFNLRQLNHLLTKANADFLVIELDGNLCGSAILLYRESSAVGRLYSIVLHPSTQGKGLGKDLLIQCETEAVSRGCEIVSLEVRSDNFKAIEFYRSQGYQEVQVLPEYYPDKTNGLRMRKKIKN